MAVDTREIPEVPEDEAQPQTSTKVEKGSIRNHVLLVLGLLVLMVFGILGFDYVGELRANQWLKPLEVKSKIELDKSDNPTNTDINMTRLIEQLDKINNPTITSEFKTRLIDQLVQIKSKAAHHRSVMVYFFVRYYMVISMLTLSAILAAVSLFFISKEGWSNANPYTITFFITTAAMSVFFGTFPTVFKQDQNIADNKALFLQYQALENEVMSYLVTEQGVDDKVIEPKLYIHYVDRQLAKLNNFAIGFDYTKVPNYKDIVFDKRE